MSDFFCNLLTTSRVRWGLNKGSVNTNTTNAISAKLAKKGLANKRILLGVTGGIAAYKSAELLRRLQDQGAEVRVVMTEAATSFITPLTMQALSGHPVHVDLLSTETESAMGHIELARWADLLLIAPATADFLAKLIAGQGDELLLALCLAANCKIAVAPAMNQAMWTNPATRANIETLQSRGFHMLEPGEGQQACGEVGEGRLMEVPDLVQAAVDIFPSGLLTGRHLVITAGPTREALDPVRYISNHSSGKQGYALARAAIEAGARVTLVTGPTNLAPVDRANIVQVNTAEEMLDAVMTAVQDADIFVGVAAVADYRPAQVADQKIKKTATPRESLTLELVPNPDILASVAALENKPFTVGFAAETEKLLEHATGKLERKKLDMIVANNVADTSIGFNADDNQTTVIHRDGTVTALKKMSKDQLGRELISLIATAIH